MKAFDWFLFGMLLFSAACFLTNGAAAEEKTSDQRQTPDSLNKLALLDTKETVFFVEKDGVLFQRLLCAVDNRSGAELAGKAEVVCGARRVATSVQVLPGQSELAVLAPCRWPEGAAEAVLTLEAGGQRVEQRCRIGTHRPWTVYELSDVCTDYTWYWTDEAKLRAADADLTRTELDMARQTDNLPEPMRNRYNFHHYREIEFFLEKHPERAEELWQRLREGSFCLSPFRNMALTSAMTLEELIRQFYPPADMASEHGFELRYANHQETPTTTWYMASLLARCDIPFLIKGILSNVDTPWLSRLAESPVFLWEGPDGRRVLVRRYNHSYYEGDIFLKPANRKDVEACLKRNGLGNAAVTDDAWKLLLTARKIPEYEAYGASYPFTALGLVGSYCDLALHSSKLPEAKVQGIKEHNEGGHTYPKVVNATHRQFWQHVQREIEEKKIQLPVSRGDWGQAWDVWPSCLANAFAGWRKAQASALDADTLAALCSALDPSWLSRHGNGLAQGWENLLNLSDHAWNRSSEANGELNIKLREKWQKEANDSLEKVVEQGLATLASKVSGGENRVLAVNTLGWERNGRLRVEGEPCRVTCAGTGKDVPVQTDGAGGFFIRAEAVPAFGYQAYELHPGQEPEIKQEVRAEGTVIESDRYRLEVSTDTGAVRSLRDKLRNREWVDANSPWHLGQFLNTVADTTHKLEEVSIRSVTGGTLFGQIEMEAKAGQFRLSTRITLPAGEDSVGFEYRLDGPFGPERHDLVFAFPINISGHAVRIETPGIIMNPATDCLPGAGHMTYMTMNTADVSAEQAGASLCSLESGQIMFGDRTFGQDLMGPNLSAATILAVAAQNRVDYKESLHTQGGHTSFSFRYVLSLHAGFNPLQTMRFGREQARPLLATKPGGDAQAQLPVDRYGFLAAAGDGVLVEGLKPAHKANGLCLRLLEVAGKTTQTEIVIKPELQINSAEQTDPLERRPAALSIVDSRLQVNIEPHGLETVRLLMLTK